MAHLPLHAYPWLVRRRAAAELTVLHSVPDVDELTVEVTDACPWPG